MWVLTLLAPLSSLRSATLTWQDNSNNETGFRIERATSDLVFAPLATVGENVTTYIDTSAAPTTTYFYRVAAINAAGMSAYSNTADTGTGTPPNTSPTISPLADQSTTQGNSVGPLAFTIADAETAASALSVTATSSNPSLVPNPSLGGSGANRTLTLSTAATQTGTATITVTVSDGQLSASDAFQVTVSTAGNSAPTISSIAGKTFNEDTSTGPLAFTVGDAETPAASLVVTASSSNPTLFPPASIVLGGSGSGRTITLTPPPNQTGSATITVTVSDGVLSRSTTFALTVYAINDPPTISAIASQTTNEDTATNPIPFVIGDIETPASSLTLSGDSSNPSLLPISGIVFGGSDANRTVTLTPAANQTGTAQITITVRDGGAKATRTFQLTVNPANQPPTISVIANQSTPEATATGAIAFTVGDLETSTSALVVTAASSNPTLLPNAGIMLGGSGANRTVTLAPATGQSGTAQITLTVSDGGATASSAFQLTVIPANTAPTISAIADQSTVEDTATGAIAFTVGDLQTPAGNLLVTATSSNQALVPGSGILLGGAGASRTVTLTPAADQSGMASITMSVSDGSATTSRTFLLTVTPVNDAPAISAIANQTIAEDSITSAISFTVSDVETPADGLIVTATSSNLTLVPVTGIALGGSGANRTLTLTPAADQNGTAQITINVSDGSATTSRTFQLTVSAVNDAPTIGAIANQSIVQDGSTSAIPFGIGDLETPTDTLAVTAASSNQTLLPNARITLGGSGANRTIMLAPAAGQAGTADVTVTVSDGQATASRTFTLSVTAANRAPTISAIADITVPPKTLFIPVNFTVSDDRTPSDQLLITGSSSNLTLILNTGLVFSGTGDARTLMLAVVPGMLGTSTITVRVSDGELAATRQFDVTVDSPPTISTVSDRTLDQGRTTGPMEVKISDPETLATFLTLTGRSSNQALVPDSRITFSGTGGSRTVRVAPLEGPSGVAVITLTVSDGVLTAETSFTVTVNPPPVSISAIADQTIGRGGSTGPLPFSISSLETSADQLTVTGRSSNTTLVPAGGIVFAGSGTNRTVTVTPAPTRTGTATIRIDVSDGTFTAQEEFVLTVQSVAAATAESVADSSTSLARVSTLGPVQADAPLMVGFVVAGSSPRDVVVRAVGPGLAGLGVAQPLVAPRLVIYNAAGQTVYAGGGWADNPAIAKASARNGYFPLAAGSLDAAAIVALSPGTYTAHVVSADGDQGMVLVDLSDAQSAGGAVAVQSARAHLLPGGTLTAGVVVDRDAPQRVLLRGVGPNLIQSAVANPMPDPQLIVRDQRGAELARMGSTSSGNAIPASDEYYSRAADVSSDSLIMTFARGAYTVTLASEHAAEGDAMIELIALP